MVAGKVQGQKMTHKAMLNINMEKGVSIIYNALGWLT